MNIVRSPVQTGHCKSLHKCVQNGLPNGATCLSLVQDSLAPRQIIVVLSSNYMWYFNIYTLGPKDTLRLICNDDDATISPIQSDGCVEENSDPESQAAMTGSLQ